MKAKTILILFFIIAQTIVAQDTLTVLQYNLLNYGNYTSYCTQSNNNINEKDEYIKTIINYAKPDIFSVNEISESPAIQQRLLDNCLNINGISYYQKVDFIKVADSYIVNMLYYNSEKLVMHSHTIAQSYIRDIDVYKLYYRSDDLPDNDTAFVVCVVAHLKSSTGSDNEEKRRTMVNNTMDYLNNNNTNDNRLFMGDFNLYKSSEPAYQLLLNYTNTDLNFFDPIDTPGTWHNNSFYSNVHSQSTHSESNGCAASGGMDDRFDFILISDDIQQGSNFVEYINGSYTTIGQDGLHFNSSIIAAPTNLSAPSNVIDAIYGNSDHLPISIKLSIDKTLSLPEDKHTVLSKITYNNPFSEVLKLNIYAKVNADIKIEILNIAGVNIINETKKIFTGQNIIDYNLSFLNTGIYFIIITDNKNGVIVKKVVKK